MGNFDLDLKSKSIEFLLNFVSSVLEKETKTSMPGIRPLVLSFALLLPSFEIIKAVKSFALAQLERKFRIYKARKLR